MVDRCQVIDSRPGTLQEILTKHTQEQYDILQATENEANESKLEELSSHYDAIYIHPVSLTFDLIFNCRRELLYAHSIITCT